MRVVGLMSGTSADAIDAALVEWPDGVDARPFELLAFREVPLGADLQSRVHRLAAGRVPGEDALRELATLDVVLGERLAEAAIQVVREAGLELADVAGIASHGQTVAHHPEQRATLQIGDPGVIAERTGRPPVADFRTRDVAAGGEGAPLAPFFHWAALSEPGETRGVLNLGGIANLTWLPADGDPDRVIAFDVGPANSLMDGVVTTATDGAERYDQGGRRAAAGRIDDDLLDELAADEFLRRSPPKSTGRERYGIAEAERLWKRAQEAGRPLEDLLATLVEFVALGVERALTDHLPADDPVGHLFVAGGGVRNPTLMDALRRRCAVGAVEPVDTAGVPAEAVEAMAFSLMGRNALLGRVNHLPRTTGAREARILGEIVPA